MPYHLRLGSFFPFELRLWRFAFVSVGEQRVTDEVGGGIKPLIQLDFGHLHGLREESWRELCLKQYPTAVNPPYLFMHSTMGLFLVSGWAVTLGW